MSFDKMYYGEPSISSLVPPLNQSPSSQPFHASKPQDLDIWWANFCGMSPTNWIGNKYIDGEEEEKKSKALYRDWMGRIWEKSEYIWQMNEALRGDDIDEGRESELRVELIIVEV